MPANSPQLTRLVRPHVAIVTAIAPAHTAFFPDESAIADAKGEIFAGLEPGGTAIVPYDSPHRDRLIGHAAPHAAQDRDVRQRRRRRRPRDRGDAAADRRHVRHRADAASAS